MPFDPIRVAYTSTAVTARAAWRTVPASELTSRLERQAAASQEGFEAIAALLDARPPQDAYDALAHAAMAMVEAEAAWLLEPRREKWVVIGRAAGSELDGRLEPASPLRKVTLEREGRVIGALAFWAAGAIQTEEGLPASFLNAIAAALQARQALEESLRDPLTGLLNRRTLDDALGRMAAFAQRSGHPLSLLMLDLDHFKRVNDTHGHEAGDQVLRAFAGVLSGSLRASDMAVRYGGEEFLAVLPDTGTDAALGVAEKLRRAVENLAIPVGDAVVRPTVSIGVATLKPGESGEALIGRADQALYRAKGAGRNRAAVG